jgi:hypothetical protein
VRDILVGIPKGLDVEKILDNHMFVGLIIRHKGDKATFWMKCINDPEDTS